MLFSEHSLSLYTLSTTEFSGRFCNILFVEPFNRKFQTKMMASRLLAELHAGADIRFAPATHKSLLPHDTEYFQVMDNFSQINFVIMIDIPGTMCDRLIQHRHVLWNIGVFSM